MMINQLLGKIKVFFGTSNSSLLESSKNIISNSTKLLLSTIFSQLFGFVSIVITARTLGPDSYGILTIVQSYGLTINLLISFQVWQAIIRYGTESIELGNKENLQYLFKICLLLDVFASFFAFIFSLFFINSAIQIFNWDQGIKQHLKIYCLTLLITFTGTPIGILRLFNRFDYLSINNIVFSLIRFLGVLYCAIFTPTLSSFVLMFLVTHFLGKIFLYLLTWVEISAQNLTRFIFSPMRKIKKVFVGFWDFVWTTNFNLTIRILSREADILLISGFVSVYEIGLFKIAKQLGQILSLIVDPIYQTIFPELSKLWIKKDYHNFINIRKRIFKIGFFVSILSWTTFLLFGKFAINIFFGEEFINVYYLTITYSIAIIISVITVSYQPTLLAIGDPKRAFLANIVATILYFVSLFFLLPLIGIQGASLSYISYYLAWSALMNNFINKHLREVKE